MFKLAVTFVAAAAIVAPLAMAQDTPALSPCILTCFTNALPLGGCSGITDVACMCTSTRFQMEAGRCIGDTCPEESVQAVAVQTAQCAALTGSGSASVSSPPSTGAPTTGSTSATPRPSSSSTGTRSGSTSATTSTSAGFHTASIASSVTLALFGAAFSLF